MSIDLSRLLDVRIARFMHHRRWPGATRDEIAESLGVLIQSVCPAIARLRRRCPAVVIETQRMRPTRSGRNARVLVHVLYAHTPPA